jgi:hypothetical protein
MFLVIRYRKAHIGQTFMAGLHQYQIYVILFGTHQTKIINQEVGEILQKLRQIQWINTLPQFKVM